MTANTFKDSGDPLTNLNVSNATSGTLSISRGGIGASRLSSNQIIIRNGSTSILQSPNLTWNNKSNTLSASNFVGSDASLTSLNASNTTMGTLSASGKVLMNGTIQVVNDYSLQIRNNNYTCPVLCIDSGLSSSQG